MHKVSAKFSWSCLYTVARTQEGNKIYKQNLCNYIHLITEHSASNEEHLIKAPRSQLSLCHSFMSWFNIQPPKPNTQASTDAQTQTVLQSSKLFFFFLQNPLNVLLFTFKFHPIHNFQTWTNIFKAGKNR
jgi:hypothetical protein